MILHSSFGLNVVIIDDTRRTLSIKRRYGIVCSALSITIGFILKHNIAYMKLKNINNNIHCQWVNDGKALFNENLIKLL